MAYKPVDTAIICVVGPLIDDTDFKSQETAIAYDAAGMSLDWIQEEADGTFTKTDLTLTTGGNNDWTHIGNGYYAVEITAAQNNIMGIGWVAGKCTGVLPFESLHYDIIPTVNYATLVNPAGSTDVLATQSSVDTIDGIVDAILVDTGTTLDDLIDTEVAAILAAVDTEVAAIKAKTDNLPAAPAATGDIPTAAAVADAVWDELVTGHDGAGKAGAQLWTDIDAILVDTGTTLDDLIDTEVAAILALLDTEVAAILAAVDTEVAAIKAKTDLIPASPAAVGDIPTAAAIADAVHDEAVEGALTLRQITRIMLAVLAGKSTGGGTTAPKFRNQADSADRVTATVDSNGNRTAMTLDGS